MFDSEFVAFFVLIVIFDADLIQFWFQKYILSHNYVYNLPLTEFLAFYISLYLYFSFPKWFQCWMAVMFLFVNE